VPDLKFQAVLFDMDGVVLDSMAQHAALWQEILAQQGFDIPLRFILRNEGALGPKVLFDFFRSQGLGQEDYPAMEFRMEELLSLQAQLYLDRYAGRVNPFPQALDLIDALVHERMPLALVTSSRRALVERCLRPEIRQRFAAVVTAQDVDRHKPHPDPYLAAARALNAEPGRCLVIENAPAGIESALASGATCYAVCTTLEPSELAQAHEVFADLGALADHLRLSSN
jgi:beta-phosphoglucomutase